MIRLARAEDAAQILEIYAPVVRETHISFETEPPSVEEMRARIEKVMAKYPWLVMERGGRVAGYAYGSEYRARLAYQWSVEATCYVHPQWRGQGVGRALYGVLLKLLRLQGFHTAIAIIALPNEASIRLHKSVGFEPAGVLREVGHKAGAWCDTGRYQLRLGGHDDAPTPPKPLLALGPGILDEL
jgi:phosphinothricin acetyltransferase